MRHPSRELAVRGPGAIPPVEMYDVVVRAGMPNPKSVTVTGDQRGGHPSRRDQARRGADGPERLPAGAAVRSVCPSAAPPDGGEEGEAKATHEDGILEVKSPTSERAKPTSVEAQWRRRVAHGLSPEHLTDTVREAKEEA